jgi:hypothetical protein
VRGGHQRGTKAVGEIDQRLGGYGAHVRRCNGHGHTGAVTAGDLLNDREGHAPQRIPAVTRRGRNAGRVSRPPPGTDPGSAPFSHRAAPKGRPQSFVPSMFPQFGEPATRAGATPVLVAMFVLFRRVAAQPPRSTPRHRPEGSPRTRPPAITPCCGPGYAACAWGYVLAISRDHLVPIGGGKTRRRADHLAAGLPAWAWTRRSAGAGSKGPRVYDWAWLTDVGTVGGPAGPPTAGTVCSSDATTPPVSWPSTAAGHPNQPASPGSYTSPEPVPHENRIGLLTCGFAGRSMRPRIR